jgi:hypothetical protein
LTASLRRQPLAVALGAGEVVQQAGEAGGRRGLRLHAQAAGQARHAAGERLLDGGHQRRVAQDVGHRGRGVARGDGQHQAVHDLHPPAQRARQLGLRHRGRRAHVGQQPLALLRRLVQQHRLALRLRLADAGQDPLLGLGPEALERAQPARLRRFLELCERADAEGRVQGGDARDGEVGDIGQLQHPGREGTAQPLELLAAAGAVDLGDGRGQGLAHAGKRGQPSLGHHRAQVGVQGLQGARPPLVGPGLERVAALDLEQEADLAQQLRDLETVHQLLRRETLRRGSPLDPPSSRAPE